MIQTERADLRKADLRKGRNPVFALEMIQTELYLAGLWINERKGRNPVFALEMIQTGLLALARLLQLFRSQSSIRPGDDSDLASSYAITYWNQHWVAIQYSPWR